jgi:excisionase family DNA binding protein
MSLTPAQLDQLAEEIADRVAARLGTGADEVGDIHAAAQWLGVSVPTLERAVRRGEVPSIKVGRLRRFRRSDLLGLKAKRGRDD